MLLLCRKQHCLEVQELYKKFLRPVKLQVVACPELNSLTSQHQSCEIWTILIIKLFLFIIIIIIIMLLLILNI